MTAAPSPGRARWWLGGASLVLLTLVGLVAWLALRPGDYVATPTEDDPSANPEPQAAAAALESLEKAVAAGDRAAARALAPPSDAAAARLLGAVVDNAAELRVRDFTLRYVDVARGPAGDGRWDAAVDMTWRFAGFDRVPVREEVLVAFVDGPGDDDGITGFGGGDRRSPVWLSGPLEVRRTTKTLVLAAGSARAADGYAERAARAVPVVRRVLPRWPGRLVLEVPASSEALDRALAAEPGTYENIAAVSASVDGMLTPESPVHVFVNPSLFDTLEPVGAQVVVSHEATHVATHAPLTTGMPLWLLEGFADYVALRDVPLPITTTAGQIIEQVQRDGPPATLPGAAEFDERATHLGAAYESAWVACTLLADLGGQGSLVRLYERVRAGADLRRPLAGLFGLTEKQLTRQWQQRLEDLAERASDAA